MKLSPYLLPVRARSCLQATLIALTASAVCLAASWLALRRFPDSVFWHAEASGWAWRQLVAVLGVLALPALLARWRLGAGLLAGASAAQLAAALLWGAVPDYLAVGDRVLDLADLALGLGFLALSVAVGGEIHRYLRRAPLTGR